MTLWHTVIFITLHSFIYSLIFCPCTLENLCIPLPCLSALRWGLLCATPLIEEKNWQDRFYSPVLLKSVSKKWKFFSPGHLEFVQIFFLLSIPLCTSQEDEAQEYSRLHTAHVIITKLGKSVNICHKLRAKFWQVTSQWIIHTSPVIQHPWSLATSSDETSSATWSSRNVICQGAYLLETLFQGSDRLAGCVLHFSGSRPPFGVQMVHEEAGVMLNPFQLMIKQLLVVWLPRCGK